MNDKFKSTIILVLGLLGILLLAFILLVLVFLRTGSKNSQSSSIPSEPSSIPAEATEQQMIEQGRSDAYFSNQEKQFSTTHPWYDSLPKRTGTYFVSFNPNNGRFVADVYTNSESEDVVKTEVLAYLKSIGVDTNKYVVNWTIYPDAPTLISQ